MKRYTMIGMVLALLLLVPTSFVLSQSDDERGYVAKIAVSGDGHTIAVFYSTDLVRYPIDFFNTRTGTLVHEMDTAVQGFADFALSPRGNRLVGTWGASSLALYDRADSSFRVIREPGQFSSFRGLFWSPVDESLVAYGLGGSVDFFNIDTEEGVDVLKSNIGNISDVAFSPDGSQVVTSSYGQGSDRSGIEIWDISQESEAFRQPLVTLEDRGGGPVAWSPDGQRIAAMGGGSFLIYNLNQRHIEVENVGAELDLGYDISWSPDGRYLATGGDFLRVWDATTYELLGVFSESFINADIVWSPDGQRIYSDGSHDKGLSTHVITLPEVEVTPEATAEVTPEVGAAPSVTGFVLVDADADEDLRPLADGDTITEGTITIRAETEPPIVGSVVFGLDDEPRFKVENEAAYALKGDDNGDYHAWLAEPGTYTLTATPYTEADGQGEAGTPLTITFTVAEPGS